MYVATSDPGTDEARKLLSQLGVGHVIYAFPPGDPSGWTADHLSRYKEHLASFDVALDSINLPLKGGQSPNIVLGKSPERDREIDVINGIIRACAEAGIPSVRYGINPNTGGIGRTGSFVGRGGSISDAFTYEQGQYEPAHPDTGRVDADTMWERIEYFVEWVAPVADEYKVRLALHPMDPPTPSPQGFRGVDHPLGSVEGLKRFIELHPSPYHGLFFCQGTISEMLERPGEDIYDVIRYFGSRNKIFNVDFRNISGGFLDFHETFIDDGDVDMLKAMRVYKEVGYQYGLTPDHVPETVNGGHGMVGHAYSFGYIKALIAAVNAEG